MQNNKVQFLQCFAIGNEYILVVVKIDEQSNGFGV